MSKTSLAILVVEDDPNTLAGYVEILQAAGFKATGVADGSEALRLAVRLRPSIVLTDIWLPGLDGFALAEALHADRRTYGIPVIGITGLWTADLRGQATKAGISTLLLKPCMPDHLLAEIHRVLKHATGSNGNGRRPPMDSAPIDHRDPPTTSTR